MDLSVLTLSFDPHSSYMSPSVAYTVNWNSDAQLANYAGNPVRLKVELKDADLFAIQFVE